MRPLYEIDAAILAAVDQETGEILDTEKLDALQMEREAKLEGVALWVKDLKAEADAVKAEADKLTARKKALENKIEGPVTVGISISSSLLFAPAPVCRKTP